LHDGALRDAFARDASTFVKAINLRESDHAAFLRLSPTDLEVQARVLLRKRFDQVRRLLPRTCLALGKSAWEHFVSSIRSNETRGSSPFVEDAYQFCAHANRVRPGSVCAQEFNRCRFANGHQRASLHLVKHSVNHRLPAIQLLIRLSAKHWHEWQIYVGI
jgi:hypothetical protein